MGIYKFLDAEGNYTDPSKTHLKYFRAGGEWAAPDSIHKFLRADREYAPMDVDEGGRQQYAIVMDPSFGFESADTRILIFTDDSDYHGFVSSFENGCIESGKHPFIDVYERVLEGTNSYNAPWVPYIKKIMLVEFASEFRLNSYEKLFANFSELIDVVGMGNLVIDSKNANLRSMFYNDDMLEYVDMSNMGDLDERSGGTLDLEGLLDTKDYQWRHTLLDLHGTYFNDNGNLSRAFVGCKAIGVGNEDFPIPEYQPGSSSSLYGRGNTVSVFASLDVLQAGAGSGQFWVAPGSSHVNVYDDASEDVFDTFDLSFEGSILSPLYRTSVDGGMVASSSYKWVDNDDGTLEVEFKQKVGFPGGSDHYAAPWCVLPSGGMADASEPLFIRATLNVDAGFYGGLDRTWYGDGWTLGEDGTMYYNELLYNGETTQLEVSFYHLFDSSSYTYNHLVQDETFYEQSFRFILDHTYFVVEFCRCFWDEDGYPYADWIPSEPLDGDFGAHHYGVGCVPYGLKTVFPNGDTAKQVDQWVFGYMYGLPVVMHGEEQGGGE